MLATGDSLGLHKHWDYTKERKEQKVELEGVELSLGLDKSFHANSCSSFSSSLNCGLLHILYFPELFSGLNEII